MQQYNVFKDFPPADGLTHRIVTPASDGGPPVHVDQDHDVEHDQQ